MTLTCHNNERVRVYVFISFHLTFQNVFLLFNLSVVIRG